MLEGLRQVGWDELRGRQGYAGEVPALLLRVRSAADAQDELTRHLVTDEFDVPEAAAAAWPFLLELVACEDTPRREWLMEYTCGSIAVAAGSQGHGVHPSWPPAWEAAKPALLALLDDDSAGVRQAALFVLSQGRGDSEPVLPALTRRWEAETDPATRLYVVVTATHFAGHGDEAVTEWLRALPVPADEPEARMFVSAATRPDPEVILRGLNGNLSVLVECELFDLGWEGVLHHLFWLVRDKSLRELDLVLALVREPSWRTEALAFLGGRAEWRERLLPHVPEWMSDPDVRLRHFALWLVGVSNAREHRHLVAEAVYDGTLISPALRISAVASSVLGQME
ncbi:hypothetical protein [Lentzea sp. NPDC055074]